MHRVRTAADIISKSGYPLETHKVTTEDGYIVTMHRIPNRASRQAVFFLHGMLDSSICWVSNGVIKSPAFEAYNQGFDVWLGNSRNTPPREHVDPTIEGSMSYWAFSVNELGNCDVDAFVGRIREVKTVELGTRMLPQRDDGSGANRITVDKDRRMAKHVSMEGFLMPKRRCKASCQNGWHNVLGGGGYQNAQYFQCGGPGPSGYGAAISRKCPLVRDRMMGPKLAKRCYSTRKHIDDRNDAPLGHKTHCQGSRRVSPSHPIWNDRRHPESDRSKKNALKHGGHGITDGARSSFGCIPTYPAGTIRTVGNGAMHNLTHDSSTQVGFDGRAGYNKQNKDRQRKERIPSSSPKEHDLFTLKGVGHSLGASSLLVYVVMCRLKGLLHGFDSLVLLAPAGFHAHLPPMSVFAYYLLKPVAWVLLKVMRFPGFGIQIPSCLTRLVAFKFLHDLRRLPALADMVRHVADVWTSGDGSAWNRAVCAPHYLNCFTPGISLHTGLHIVQWFHSGSFNMYDYGNAKKNTAHYGVPRALDLAANYGKIDIPVHFMSGTNDGVISRDNVRMHVEAAKKAGTQVSYREFASSHLDFASTMKEEVMHAMMERLREK